MNYHNGLYVIIDQNNFYVGQQLNGFFYTKTVEMKSGAGGGLQVNC